MAPIAQAVQRGYARTVSVDLKSKPQLSRGTLALLITAWIAGAFASTPMEMVDYCGRFLPNELIGVVLLFGPAILLGWTAKRKGGAPSKQAIAILGVYYVAFGAAIPLSRDYRFNSYIKELTIRGVPTSVAAYQEDLPSDKYALPALTRAVVETHLVESRKGLPGFPGRNKLDEHWTRLCVPWESGRFDAAYMPRSHLSRVNYAAMAKDPWAQFQPQVEGFYLVTIGALLRACADDHSKRGETAKSWSDVRRLIHLADLAATEPSLTGAAAALALERQAAHAAIGVVTGRPGVEIPADVVHEFQRQASNLRLPAAMKADLALSLDRGRLPQDRSKSMEIDAYATAREYEGLSDIGHWREAQAATRAIEMEQKRLPYPPYLSAFWVPARASYFEPEFDTRNWLRMALLANELNAYRRSKGRYPDELEGLKPDPSFKRDSFDEFKGGTFAYSAAGGDGFQLCSRGASGDWKDFCVRSR